LAPERKACFQAKGPLHNTISTRNEGSAGLGGRICPVMTAPAGGQAGAVRCCHRAEAMRPLTVYIQLSPARHP
jgi:hypothetical protein